MQISIGPPWVGRTCARWMLDTFLPDRGDPVLPAYPAMPLPRELAAGEACQQAMDQAARARARAAQAQTDLVCVLDAMASFLRRHPSAKRAWERDGLPPL